VSEAEWTHGKLEGMVKYLKLYLHYCLRGRWRDAHKLALVAQSEYFDADYYLEINADVLAAKFDPVIHFLDFGGREKRNPSELFNTAHYLSKNADAVKAGINPLIHYLRTRRSADPLHIRRVSTRNRLPIADRARHHRLASRYIPDSPVKATLPLPDRYVVYTTVIGGYDDLQAPAVQPPGCDFVAFSDHPLEVPGWKVVPLNYLHRDPTRAARFVKLHPHVYFPEYSHSIWMDANIGVRGDISAFFDCLSDGFFMGAFAHPLRDCIYEEGAECILRRKDREDVILNHLARYREMGMPDAVGLWETGFLVRRHNEAACIDAMCHWWREIEMGSRRDQLSLPAVLWQRSHQLAPLGALDVCARQHPLLTFKSHRKDKTLRLPDAAWPVERLLLEKPVSDPITVAICVHNGLEVVRNCLLSVVHARRVGDRVIVVDDASDAPTADFLVHFAAEHTWVELIRNDENLGYTRSANLALKLVATDWVVLLNSDTVVPPNALRKLVAAGERFPRLAIVGPLSNAASWQSVPGLKGADGTFLVNQLPQNLSPEDMDRLCEKAALDFLPFVPLVNGFCLAIRRSALEHIGYFDETSFPLGYGEEDDLCIRAADAGYACGIATNTYVFHSKSASFTAERRTILSATGRAALNAKYGPDRLAGLSSYMLHHGALRLLRRKIRSLLNKRLRIIARHQQGTGDQIHPSMASSA
jgi:GT2 family glycosyltransferase